MIRAMKTSRLPTWLLALACLLRLGSGPLHADEFDFEKSKTAVRLLTIEGAAHAFSPKQNEEMVRPAILEWFGKHLASK